MRNLLILAPLLVAAACATHKTKDEVPVNDYSNASTPPPTLSSNSTQPSNQSGITGNTLNDPNGILAKRSVYFDFDSNVVKSEYAPLVQAHSSFMMSHADAQARVEGNCDERGSREYNLALGQRRAESLKQMMTALGVPSSRIETVSYGEEKPVANGHDESSWASNRRDDLRYVGR